MAKVQRFTNNSGISLATAVWLAHDEYDHVDPAETEQKYISVTGMLKPTRSIILAGRVQSDGNILPDIADEVRAAMGTAFHSGVERAWSPEFVRVNLEKLGYPKRVIDLVRINPTKEELAENPDIIAVYQERRATRELDGYVIGGKFDMVLEGRLNDFKSTSVFTYKNQTNNDNYRIQGSIYRWLNQDIITDDHIYIQYIFTDWSANFAKSDPRYPRSRVLEYPVLLMSIQETENWLRNKLRELTQYLESPEAQLPLCTADELWRSDPVFKYYKDPSKTAGRSTKNFTDLHEANLHLANEGKGIVVPVPGEVKRCKYCAGYALCSQKDALIASGDLKLESAP